MEPNLVEPGLKIDISNSFSQKIAESILIVCRALFNTFYTVPVWSGWLSKTSINSNGVTKSEVGYMAPILHPITEYSTVQQCLIPSMDATEQLNQEYTLVTMDLAAAKIAYDIQWGNPDKYSKLFINLGPFHTMCSYMRAIGKMMTGCGFEEVLVESGICANSSIDKVLSGKHYNRAIRIHQIMTEAVERMVLAKFNESESTDDEERIHLLSLPEMEHLANSPSYISMIDVEDSTDCKNFLNRFELYKNKIRNGVFGKTAQFWLLYCDSVWTLLRFQNAVKENNLELYIYSIRQMCKLLFT